MLVVRKWVLEYFFKIFICSSRYVERLPCSCYTLHCRFFKEDIKLFIPEKIFFFCVTFLKQGQADSGIEIMLRFEL